MPPPIHNSPSRPLKRKGIQPYTPFLLLYDLLARAVLPQKPHILVACMPKSGSTFLTNLVASHAGIQRRKLVPVYDDREQELCELKLTRNNARAYVSQMHLKNSAWTQEMIARYNIKTIVLVRDLLDAVASIRDHIRKERHFGSLVPVTQYHVSMPDEVLDDMIVQLVMPWYLSFYFGWKQDSQALFIHYEDIVSNPAGSLTDILSFAQVPFTAGSIEAAVGGVQAKSNRMNKGISGRGQEIHAQTRARLADMLEFYPEIAQDRLFTSLR